MCRIIARTGASGQLLACAQVPVPFVVETDTLLSTKANWGGGRYRIVQGSTSEVVVDLIALMGEVDDAVVG
ncbi:MAG: hypothetical protein M3506_04695 [Chloroflexota bacterium]|nr:hypothetical protein [Chloroflexota bacterium]